MPTSRENLESLDPITPPTAEEFVTENLDLIEQLRLKHATFEQIHHAIMTGDTPPRKMTVETLKTNYYRARKARNAKPSYKAGVLSFSQARNNQRK